MKEWQTLPIEYTLAIDGIFNSKYYPKVRFVDPSEKMEDYEKKAANIVLQRIGKAGWE